MPPLLFKTDNYLFYLLVSPCHEYRYIDPGVPSLDHQSTPE